MPFYSRSKKNKLITFIFCLPFLSAFYAFSAAETDCVEAGGKASCLLPEPSDWSVSYCIPANAYPSRHAALCKATGGTYMGAVAKSCPGGKPITEENYIDVAQKYISNSNSLCKIESLDTSSWGDVTADGWHCRNIEKRIDGGIEVYSGQILTFSGQSKSSNGQCDTSARSVIYADRSRELKCPDGYYQRINQDGNKECYKVKPFVASPKENGPAQSCQTPSKGEPIRIGTGNMYHIDTDLSGPLPLVRTYNSSLGKWTFNTAIYLQFAGNISVLHLGDGKQYTYKKIVHYWESDPDVYHRLEETSEENASWRITFADSSQALFNDEGQILEFKKPQGESITYEHTYNRTTITDS
ncbi:DUF6531 domain-containing protein, partial [Zooshikella harenae]